MCVSLDSSNLVVQLVRQGSMRRDKRRGKQRVLGDYMKYSNRARMQCRGEDSKSSIDVREPHEVRQELVNLCWKNLG
jgi:hypothetical protein